MRNFMLFAIAGICCLFAATPANATEFVMDEFGNILVVRSAPVVYGGVYSGGYYGGGLPVTVATTNRVFVAGGYGGSNVVAINRGFGSNVVAINGGRRGSNVVAVNRGGGFGGGVNIVSVNERRGIFGGLRSRSVNIVQAR